MTDNSFYGEHGVWSDAAGGFVETGLYLPSQVDEAVARLVGQGEDRDDLTVLAICPDHEERPAQQCEDCDGEDSDGEAGGDGAG